MQSSRNGNGGVGTKKPTGGGGVQLGVKANDPCRNVRNPIDVVGRLDDLINCKLQWLILVGDRWKTEVLPIVIVGVILLVIMILAARELLK